MNKGDISRILRKVGLMHLTDKVRYVLARIQNKSGNSNFKTSHPQVILPPDYLMYESFQLNYQKYYYGGLETAKWILSLANTHIDLQGAHVLDWGCGPARVLRHMPSLLDAQSKIYGTDYNATSIDWCSNNILDVDFNLNTLEAQLPYADNSLDLIYGISIFTHLSKDKHFDWYRELRRVLRPGGILIVTTQGDNFLSILSASEKVDYRNGQLVIRGDVVEGHRVYSSFHPDQFLQDLFAEDRIAEVVKRPITDGSAVPQDVWIIKKI